MSIDHKTCGYKKHIVLDPKRVDELHSAIVQLLVKWGREEQIYRLQGLHDEADVYNEVVDDLVRSFTPFEVER